MNKKVKKIPGSSKKPSIKDMIEESESAIRKLRMSMLKTKIEQYAEQNQRLEWALTDAQSKIKLLMLDSERLAILQEQIDNIPRWLKWIVK